MTHESPYSHILDRHQARVRTVFEDLMNRVMSTQFSLISDLTCLAGHIVTTLGCPTGPLRLMLDTRVDPSVTSGSRFNFLRLLFRVEVRLSSCSPPPSARSCRLPPSCLSSSYQVPRSAPPNGTSPSKSRFTLLRGGSNTPRLLRTTSSVSGSPFLNPSFMCWNNT